MKTLSALVSGLVLGVAIGYYYVAIGNTYQIAYTNGAVDTMSKVCPTLTDKFKAPAAQQK